MAFEELRRKESELAESLRVATLKAHRAEQAATEIRVLLDAVRLVLRKVVVPPDGVDIASADAAAETAPSNPHDGGEAGRRERGLAAIVRREIAAIDGDFGSAEVVNRLRAPEHGGLKDVTELQIRKVLARLGREGELHIVSEGVGKRAAVYRAKH